MLRAAGWGWKSMRVGNAKDETTVDERSIHEVTDPAQPARRYYLCRSPQAAQHESDTRQSLQDLTATALAEIGAYKRASTVEKRGALVGKVLAKYKMGSLSNGPLTPIRKSGLS
jgi:hypothetical protein